MIVVDASVAAKWYLPEPGSEEATKLLRSSDPLFAPALIKIEVNAAVLRQFRKNEIKESFAVNACHEWQRTLDEENITLIPDEELFPDAIRWALQIRHPFQDCLYLACADRLKLPLITADPKFQARAAKVFPAITLLPGVQTN